MLLPVKGGESRGVVGTCKIGRGGAFEESGSVTPGMRGIRDPGMEIWRGEICSLGLGAGEPIARLAKVAST